MSDESDIDSSTNLSRSGVGCKESFKRYDVALRNAEKKLFFDTVTNAIVNGVDDENGEMYEIDNEDEIRILNENVNESEDACEHDKKYFILWNNFAHQK
jgi:hypothetical protein